VLPVRYPPAAKEHKEDKRTEPEFLNPRIDSKESIPPAYVAWARIFKRLWSPRNDSKESIPPAYVAWRASTTTIFLFGS
jgi:hypothetical protein